MESLLHFIVGAFIFRSPGRVGQILYKNQPRISRISCREEPKGSNSAKLVLCCGSLRESFSPPSTPRTQSRQGTVRGREALHGKVRLGPVAQACLRLTVPRFFVAFVVKIRGHGPIP